MSGQSGTKVIIIKKKSKHAGHHGGAWKVAYADFVTAMMALFIVLWLLTQTDQQSKEALAQYFRTGTLPGGTLMLGQPAGSNPPVALNIFSSGVMGSPDDLATLAKEISEILTESAKDPEMAPLIEHIALKQTPDGTLIELIDGSDNYLFAVASPKLKPAAVLFLSKLAPLLGKLKNKLEIHGHTDARPFDPTAKKSNWDLSFERANEARRVLEQNGVATGRIVGVQAHADAQPYDKKDRYSAQNRRLSILILKIKRSAKPAATGDSAADTPAQAPSEAATPEPTPSAPSPAPGAPAKPRK